MSHSAPSRRQMLKAVAAAGVGSAVFQRAVVAQAPKDGPITEEMVKQAEWITGLKLTDAERKNLVGKITASQRAFERLRKIEIPNDVPPAFAFVPAPGPAKVEPRGRALFALVGEIPPKPATDEELAFSSVKTLAALISTRAVSSVELTKLYLDRLKKYNPALKCVVTLTEDLALKQAAAADAEIAAGKYRGPLHGIPWGAKDLISYPGYKTTWGAGPYKDQTLDTKATVAQKLEEAGAVMVAKLTLGALAMGDEWFGGMTRNPWDVKQGSSGSSAGSASAVAAGLVGFAIGTETLGSIVSPSIRCGVSSLRPTFGRVSRAGCMALAWTMDKLGPMARSLEDCAFILNAIHGSDPGDLAAVDRPFKYPGKSPKELRVGYFEGRTSKETLEVLKEIGVKLVPIKLPSKHPAETTTILYAECAAAFDDLTRKGINDGIGSWPGTFRQGQFIPAVEYIRANRVRTLLMRDMAELFQSIDLYVGGDDLFITNLTGHPTAVMPNGFVKRKDVEVPTSITFTGNLYVEADLLTVASAFQTKTKHHLRHPPMDKVTAENADAKK